MYFREYLIEHPMAAMEYEKMKLKIWEDYEHSRGGYTEAERIYKNRYRCSALAGMRGVANTHILC